MKREKQAPVSYESGTRNISAKNVQLIQSRVQGTQAPSHCDGVDRTCLTNEEHCWSLWAVWLNLRYTMLMFLNLILYPHTIPTCYTHILHSHSSMLLYSGEGKKSEQMKWGKKCKHLYHMRQLQGISQHGVQLIQTSDFTLILKLSFQYTLILYPRIFHRLFLCSYSRRSRFFIASFCTLNPYSYTIINIINTERNMNSWFKKHYRYTVFTT